MNNHKPDAAPTDRLATLREQYVEAEANCERLAAMTAQSVRLRLSELARAQEQAAQANTMRHLPGVTYAAALAFAEHEFVTDSCRAVLADLAAADTSSATARIHQLIDALPSFAMQAKGA